MPKTRLFRLLALFILIMGIATPLFAFSSPAVDIAYAEEGEEEEGEGEVSAETSGNTGDNAGAAIVGGIIALVLLIIFAVAIITAVSLGLIGIGYSQTSGGED